MTEDAERNSDTVGAVPRPDEAEVDQADHLARQDQQVARMRIAWKKPSASTSLIMPWLRSWQCDHGHSLPQSVRNSR